LMCDTRVNAAAEIPGIKLPSMAMNIDESSAIAMMPMVGGHLIHLSLT